MTFFPQHPSEPQEIKLIFVGSGEEFSKVRRSVMYGGKRITDRGPEKRRACPALAARHVADDVGGQDGGKAVGARAARPRLARLSDPPSVVRATTLQLVLEHGDDNELTRALAICIERGTPDVLRKAWTASPIARELIVRSLADDSGTTRQIRIALDSIIGVA